VAACYGCQVGFGLNATREVPFPLCAFGVLGLLDLPESPYKEHITLKSFADLGISSPVVSALAARDITKPFPVQQMVVSDALAGHDLLVQSPTGSGKTLAFGIPIVDRIEAGEGLSALVLAPTRELASQIVDELDSIARARQLRIAAVYGGVGFGPQSNAARRADIVVATPGRLEDLLSRNTISLNRVRILVLDEADRMLDMGFKPAVSRIVAQTPGDRQTLFFSATLEGATGKLAAAYTRDARRHTQEPTEHRERDIEHSFVHVESQSAKLDHLTIQLKDAERGRTLVFVRTKRGADRLVKRLRSREVDAVAMHGDKSQGQRERALARFEKGEVDTLIATDVAARGIDVADVTHVINFDAPGDQDAYTHRIGRTGRAGNRGAGISFVLEDQVGEMRRIARDLGLSREFDLGRPAGSVQTETASTPRPNSNTNRDGNASAAQKRRRRRRRSKAKVAA
jgi:ATP-dependent RNA helicase RhlE